MHYTTITEVEKQEIKTLSRFLSDMHSDVRYSKTGSQTRQLILLLLSKLNFMREIENYVNDRNSSQEVAFYICKVIEELNL